MAFLTLAVADEQRRLAEHSVLIRNPLFRAGSFVRCNRGSVKSFYVVAVAWGCRRGSTGRLRIELRAWRWVLVASSAPEMIGFNDRRSDNIETGGK